MSTGEIYKVIPEYPRYSISNYGNVINNTTGHSISQRKTTNGYMRFNVRKGNVKYETPKSLMTHRVVAELFLPKVQGKPYINHKDADKTNNFVGNLEWCTPQENSRHAVETIEGLKEKYQQNIAKACALQGKPIIVHKDGVFVGRYSSKVETAQALGIDAKTIYNGLYGMKNRKGYTFAFDRKGENIDL